MVHRVPCHFHAQLQLAKICSLPLNGCSQIPPHNKHYTHCLTSDSQITHPISNLLHLSNFIIIIIVILLHPIRALHKLSCIYNPKVRTWHHDEWVPLLHHQSSELWGFRRMCVFLLGYERHQCIGVESIHEIFQHKNWPFYGSLAYVSLTPKCAFFFHLTSLARCLCTGKPWKLTV